MLNLFALAAIVLYAVASYLCFQPLKGTAINPWAKPTAAAALLAHGLTLSIQLFTESGLRLGFFNAGSLVFCCINLVVLLSSLRRPVAILLVALQPLSALAILCSLIWSHTPITVPLQGGLAAHILLSILAYSFFTMAMLQALLLWYQNNQLRSHHPKSLITALPPIQTMESLLFEMISWGMLLLSAAIISGFLFLEDLFAQHLVHKTVLSIAAWVIWGSLLAGRLILGWRGNTAIRWTLVGFASLMLAYFGSKLVLELILER